MTAGRWGKVATSDDSGVEQRADRLNLGTVDPSELCFVEERVAVGGYGVLEEYRETTDSVATEAVTERARIIIADPHSIHFSIARSGIFIEDPGQSMRISSLGNNKDVRVMPFASESQIQALQSGVRSHAGVT
jgi:hypothetical protein